MKNNGKRYNEDFKADVIKLILEENRLVSSVAKDFGVNSQTIRNWINKTKRKADPDEIGMAELKAELKKTKKKLRDSELSVDILKKCTAIFAKTNRE